MSVRLRDYASAAQSPLAPYLDHAPWTLTTNAGDIVRQLVAACDDGYASNGDIAIHKSATLEPGAAIKGPAIIGPECFIASTALVRGGCWLERACIIGPAAELKTSFVFAGSKLAHLNFVGDTILGVHSDSALRWHPPLTRPHDTHACARRSRRERNGRSAPWRRLGCPCSAPPAKRAPARA